MTNNNMIFIANWKMNGDKSSISVVNSINKSLQRKRYNSKIVICPPFTVLDFYSRSFKRSKISFGSQDCHQEESGAYTGCVSSKMIKDTGSKFVKSENNMLTTIAYRINNKTTYALEGSIFIAGAVIQWLRDEMKFLKSADKSGIMAEEADQDQRLYFVPAFTGLGAPYWQPDVRGAIFGLNRNT